MILCVVQARSSSNRLPGKVLKPILGKPMILHELDRLRCSKRISKIVLATSIDDRDNELASVVAGNGIEVYRGSLDDVLDRYYQCAKKYQPEHIVRITGDCPMIDWRIVDAVIDKHLTEGNDYTSTSEDYPDGLDTEVIRFSVLEQAWKDARMSSEREHVTLYIRNHADQFRCGQMACRQNLNWMRWTVDEPQDFEFIRQVYEELYGQNNDFSMQDILQLLERRPELLAINQGIQRNEGLLKSLREDKNLRRGIESCRHSRNPRRCFNGN